MTVEEVIRLLKIEHTCSQADCDRNCSKCPIVQEQETLDEMYKKAIQLIEENAELKALHESDKKAIEIIMKKWEAERNELKAHCKAVDEVNEKMKCCGNCNHYFKNETIRVGNNVLCRNGKTHTNKEPCLEWELAE